MNIPRTIVAGLCRKYGPQIVALPAGVDGARLLWAIAGNESTFGDDMSPRHEASHCYGGAEFNARATAAWGCLAHMSYGPWQLMFANMPPGLSPLTLATDTETMARWTARFIQQYALGVEKAKSIEQIAEVYNAGHIVADPGYVEKLKANYAELMP